MYKYDSNDTDRTNFVKFLSIEEEEKEEER